MLNLNAFSNKPKRVVSFTGERKGQYDETAVLLVQSVKNSVKLPRGASQTILGVKPSENAVGIAPNFFNGSLTMETLTSMNAELAATIREAGLVLTGEQVIEKFASEEIHKLMPAEDKKALMESIVVDEEYPMISLIFKKDVPVEITAGEYKKLSKEEQLGYNLRAKENRATADGMVGKEGSFSCASAYYELGGSDKVYSDEACTIETEVNVEEDQYTKQLVYAIEPAMDFGGGQMLHVSYLKETNCRTSMKGQSHSNEDEDDTTEDAPVATEAAITDEVPVVEEDTKESLI